jgi:hypothetical protein
MSRFIGVRKAIIFVVAVAALAIGVTIAGARSGPSQQKTHFQIVNSAGSICGGSALTKHEVGKGFARIESKSGPVQTVDQFRGVDPGEVRVFAIDGACTALIADFGSFSVGGDGDGTFKGSAVVPKQTFFFLGINIDTGQLLRSTLVHLGG